MVVLGISQTPNILRRGKHCLGTIEYSYVQIDRIETLKNLISLKNLRIFIAIIVSPVYLCDILGFILKFQNAEFLEVKNYHKLQTKGF